MIKEIFDKITLVVPTYDNRYPSLFGLLEYYSSYGFPMKIVVVDSNSNGFSHTGLHELLSHERVSYQKVDPDITFWPKVLLAVESVTTPYCVFCGDEDFVTPNGISQATKFLEENPDYSVANGRDITFLLEKDANGNSQFCVLPKSGNLCQSIIMPDPQSRLHFHFSTYSASFYAVHRTDFQKMVLNENINYGMDTIFGELLPTMLTAIHGKIKFLDVLYTACKRSDKYVPNLSIYVQDGTFNEKYIKFKKCILTHLVSNSDLDPAEANKVVDTAFEVYYRLYCQREKELVAYYDQIHKQLPEFSRNDAFPLLAQDPSTKYYDDFRRIKKYVLDYHENPVENFIS